MNTRRPQPRIVMLVANNFQHDTRVYKEARSLIEWGCEVHIIALYDRELPVSRPRGAGSAGTTTTEPRPGAATGRRGAC